MPFSSADPNAGVWVAPQTALGTPQAAAAKFRFIRYLSGTDLDPQITAVDLREGGDGLDWGFTYQQQSKQVGQITLNARPENVGQLLSILPGGATWDGASAPAAHTFSTLTASHPYSTIIVAHPGTSVANLLYDVRFTGLTIEIAAGQPWKLTMPFVGINYGASAAIPFAPTNYGEDAFLMHYSPTFVLDGSADATIQAVKFDLGLGIDELQTQKTTLDDITVMNRDANVEVTRRFESITHWQKVYFGAGITPTQSIATGSLRADSFYVAGGATRSISLNTPLVTWRVNSLTELDPDGKTVYETISGKALKAATAAAIIYVKNGHASAYLP